MSGVSSKEIGPNSPGRTTRPNAPLQPGGLPGFSIGFVGMLISGIIWLIGARWTIDGLVVMFNAVLRFFNTSYQAPIPPEVLVYVCLSPCPFIFSIVEWHVPLKRESDEWYFAKPGSWIVWLAVFIFDAFTTYLGLGVDPGSESVTFMRQLAASTIPRAVFSFILTTGPEWLAREMWAHLRFVFTGRRK